MNESEKLKKLGKKVTVLMAAVMGAACVMSSMSITARATEGALQSESLGQAVPGIDGDSALDDNAQAETGENNGGNTSDEETTQQTVHKHVQPVQNNKLDFGDWSLTSNFEGHYYAKGVPGIVIVDYEYNVRSQANMSPVEYFYVSTWDITQDTAPLAVNTFRVVAQSQNALLGPVVQININKTISGKMYSLEGNPARVNTMIGIPEDFRDPGASFAVVCVKSGGVYEIIPDTDSYDSTVTFSAKVGDAAYALIRYPKN